jgi:hypothetical protein
LGCVFRLAALVIPGFVFFALVGVAVGGYMAFTGAPQPCVDRDSEPAPGAGQTLAENWRQLANVLAGSENVELVVTDDEASAFGAEYLEDRDVPVEDFRLYFCPGGYAEATGKVGILGFNSNVLLRGTIDVSGRESRVDIDAVRAGRIPDFIARPLVDLFVDEENVAELPLAEQITAIEYRNGTALVTASAN